MIWIFEITLLLFAHSSFTLLSMSKPTIKFSTYEMSIALYSKSNFKADDYIMLEHDITNPDADKRHDWKKAETIQAGKRFKIIEREPGVPTLWPVKGGCVYAHEDLFLTIIMNSRVVPQNVDELLDDTHISGSELIERLILDGHLKMSTVQAVAHAMHTEQNMKSEDDT
jgi:hypothetical protein